MFSSLSNRFAPSSNLFSIFEYLIEHSFSCVSILDNASTKSQSLEHLSSLLKINKFFRKSVKKPMEMIMINLMFLNKMINFTKKTVMKSHHIMILKRRILKTNYNVQINNNHMKNEILIIKIITLAIQKRS